MQQHEEKKFVAPVLVGKVFPYAVVVKASDADGPGEYTAKGLMYENAQILIEYPFVKPGQSVESALADGAGAADHNQIDIHEAVLPDGSTLCRGESWEEAAHVPDWSSRIGAAVAVFGDASFNYGEHNSSTDGRDAGNELHAVLEQAKGNLDRLLGVPSRRLADGDTVKVAVLCSNAEGATEVFRAEPFLAEVDIGEGEHLDVAIEHAKEAGFSGAMVAFDQYDVAAGQLFDAALWFAGVN